MTAALKVVPKKVLRTIQKRDAKISVAQTTAYQAMFDWFNERLFESTLPQVLLSFTRRPRSAGHFAPERWDGEGENKAHEICLNPTELLNPVSAAQTIVHEMAHLWQHAFGSPPRKAYHDREWGKKMKELGLYPSATGQPGGKETGQHMADYVIEGGPFAAAFAAMPKTCLMPWRGRRELADGKNAGTKAAASPSSKTKFTCPECSANAWAKPDSNILCGDCSADSDTLVKMEVVP